MRGQPLGRLVVASVAMIALGYPGEIAATDGARHMWGQLSTVPFVQKDIIDRVALLASRAKGSPAQQVPSAAEMRQP